MNPISSKYRVLKKYFGYTTFRPGQAEIIDSILSGRDTLGILPTGGGKSLCYQIPALLLPGITLVISPLISLIDDQVAGLLRRGIPAGALTSAVPASAKKKTYDDAAASRLKLLYLSPERFISEEFRRAAENMNISLICIDEAHCISKWGKSFRPSYLSIRKKAASYRKNAVMAAFTATAGSAVRKDIVNLLGLKNPFLKITGFDRPNLYYGVIHPDDKYRMLILLLARYRGSSGVVFAGTRQLTESLSERLSHDGFHAICYHAGLSAGVRAENQNRFLRGEVKILIATCAFGMGIDKPDIRFVIHYNMPVDIEGYYQEAGRAGRDGKPAECILMADDRDTALARKFIGETPGKDLRAEMQSDLQKMRLFASGKTCLRSSLLSYFGESSPKCCGYCSACRGRVDLPPAPGDGSGDQRLYRDLESFRHLISKDRKIKAYRIFNDQSLRDIAEKKPKHIGELISIEGIPVRSAIKYGADFLTEIRTFLYCSYL